MQVPKNLEVLVKRLGGYVKNNIKVISANSFYNSVNGTLSAAQKTQTGQPQPALEIALPTNGIIDLESLTVLFDINITTTEDPDYDPRFGLPRFPEQLVKNVVVKVGGQTVTHHQGGAEYASIFTMLQNAFGTNERSRGVGAMFNGGIGSGSLSGPDLVVNSTLSDGASNTTFVGCTLGMSGVLGFLQGKYQRFLDLSLLPQITISFMPNEQNACWTANGLVWWLLNNFRVYVDEVEFGDATYHAMLSSLLARGPIEIPFANYAFFQGNRPAVVGNDMVLEALVSSGSIDSVIGAARPAAYSGPFLDTGNRTNILSAGTTINGVVYPDNSATGVTNLPELPLFTFTGAAFAASAANAPDGLLGAPFAGNTRYQFLVGSKTFPRYPADAYEAAMLARANGNALGLNTAQSAVDRVVDINGFMSPAFAFPISMHHNGDQAGFTRRDMITGASTEGSPTDIRFTVTSVGGEYTAGYVPCMLVEVTSRLLVFPERVVQLEY